MKLLPVVVLALLISSCGHFTKKGTPSVDAPKVKSATVAKVEGEIVKSYTCVNGKDSRVIALQKLEKSYRVSYTKAGKTTFPAKSKGTDATFCQEKCDKIKANLENSGYKCE